MLLHREEAEKGKDLSWEDWETSLMANEPLQRVISKGLLFANAATGKGGLCPQGLDEPGLLHSG